MAMTPLDVRKQQFRRVMRGIDADEVKIYDDVIIVVIGRGSHPLIRRQDCGNNSLHYFWCTIQTEPQSCQFVLIAFEFNYLVPATLRIHSYLHICVTKVNHRAVC